MRRSRCRLLLLDRVEQPRQRRARLVEQPRELGRRRLQQAEQLRKDHFARRQRRQRFDFRGVIGLPSSTPPRILNCSPSSLSELTVLASSTGSA